jgi:tetratricopeptide (TPR) repeat protein
MQRIMLGALAIGALGLTAAAARAGDDTPKKDIEELNRLTGDEPTEGMLQLMLDRKDRTKALIQAALPLAEKKKGLSFTAALLLGLAAADEKDLKAADVFLHLCADVAAKQQSTSKLELAYRNLIDMYNQHRKYADTVRICEELLALKTDDREERLVYKAFTDDRGETDYNEHATFDSAGPLRQGAKKRLAEALAKLGKHDEALKLADELVESKDDWRGQRFKATLLRDAGQFERAATIYESILKRLERDSELDPEVRDGVVEVMRYELSNIYVDFKKIDRAAEQLEILLKNKPDEAGYHNDLGYILADHDLRLDEAEKLIRKALDLDRAQRQKRPKFDPKTDHDRGAYLDSLGWVLFKKKQYAEARKYLELAVEDKKAQHIEIYDHLGDVCLVLGDRDGAIRAWEEGLKHVTETRRDQERKSDVQKKLERAKDKSASK